MTILLSAVIGLIVLVLILGLIYLLMFHPEIVFGVALLVALVLFSYYVGNTILMRILQLF